MDNDTLAPPDQSTRITELERQLAEARRRHQTDIATIGDKLIELANEHGWCDTFDDEVDNLNRQLHVGLPTRHVNYSVTVCFGLTVRARNDDEAQEAADQWAYDVYNNNDGTYNDCLVEAGDRDVTDVERD